MGDAERLERPTTAFAIRADVAAMLAAGPVAPPGYCRGVDGKCYPRNMHEPVRWADGTPMTAAERRAEVLELRAVGRSLRSIAAELRVSHEQARRDVAELSRAGKLTPRERVTGRDGRSYPARQVSRAYTVQRDT